MSLDEVHERLPERTERGGGARHAYEPLLDTETYHMDVEEDGDLVRRFGYEAAWPTALGPDDLLDHLAADIDAYYEGVDVDAAFVEHERNTLDGFAVFPGVQGDPTLNYPALLDRPIDEIKDAADTLPVDYGAMYVAEAMGDDRVTLKDWIRRRERENDGYSVEGDLGRIMEDGRFPERVGLLRIDLGPADTLTWVRDEDGYNELRIEVSTAEELNVSENGVVGADVDMPDTTTFIETYLDTLPDTLAAEAAEGEGFQDGEEAAMHAAGHVIAKVREDYDAYTAGLEERRPDPGPMGLLDYARLALRDYL